MLAAHYNLELIEEQLKLVEQAETEHKESAAPQVEPASGATQSSSAALPSSSATAATTAESTQQNTAASAAAQTTPAQMLNNPAPSAQLSEQNALPTQRPDALQTEPPLHLESWLEQIPDNPSELLRRKFWYEQSQQESAP